jgi:hypothetical protein
MRFTSSCFGKAAAKTQPTDREDPAERHTPTVEISERIFAELQGNSHACNETGIY